MNKNSEIQELEEQIQELQQRKKQLECDIDKEFEECYLAFTGYFDEELGRYQRPSLRRVKAKIGNLNFYNNVEVKNEEAIARGYNGNYFVSPINLYENKAEAIAYLREQAQKLLDDYRENVTDVIDDFECDEAL